MPNSYYSHGNFPANNTVASSASMRQELDAIASGFDLLPTPDGSGGFTTAVAVGAASASTHAVQQQQVAGLALPSQTSNSGKFLTTNGTAASWVEVPDNSVVMAIALG